MTNRVTTSTADTLAWWTLILFLLMVLAANWLGTEYIAWHLGASLQLGNSISFQGIHIYYPWKWIDWVTRWWNAKGEVDRVLTNGMLIVSAGTISGVLFAAWINFRRTSKKNTPDDIHGSARFAEIEDIEKSGLLGNAGVVCGVYSSPAKGLAGLFGRSVKHILYDSGDTHTIMAAPTRSGKGVGVVLPTLLGGWRESALINDVKMENFALSGGYRHKAGHLVLAFSPTCKDGTGARWNPMAEIAVWTMDDVRDAQNLAGEIVDIVTSQGNDKHWDVNATKLIAATILHILYSSAEKEKNLARANSFLTDPLWEDNEQMFNSMLNEAHDPDGKMGWRDTLREPTKTHPFIAELASEMMKKEAKEQSGVISTAKAKLAVFSEPVVAMNTCVADFTAHDLMNCTQPLSVYYILPPNDKERLRPLTRIFISFVIRRLTEKMDFAYGQSVAGYRHRLLALVDELPSLRKIDIIEDGLAYVAGYGIKFLLIIQELIQLQGSFGDKQTVWSGCHRKILYAPNQYKTAQEISHMLGKETLEYENRAHSGSRVQAVLGQVSINHQSTGRELFTPDELMQLPPNEMLLLQSGSPPIHGEKLRYYEIPVLKERAAIAPPTRITVQWANDDGVVNEAWVVILVEVDAQEEVPLRLFLNRRQRARSETMIVPPLQAKLRQRIVLNGQVTDRIWDAKIRGGEGGPVDWNSLETRNALEMQLTEPGLLVDEDFFVSLVVDPSAGHTLKNIGDHLVRCVDQRLLRESLSETHPEHKIHIADAGRSFGEIIAESDKYVAQEIEHDNILLHSKRFLSNAPLKGERVTITYGNSGIGHVA